MLTQTFLLGVRPPGVELPGVAVKLTGETHPYSGWRSTGAEPGHCIFADDEWGIEITVPEGARGEVAVYAYAPDGQRRQTVAFGNRELSQIDDLTKGTWLEYPFTETDSSEGQLRLTVRRLEGANCVLSKLRITIAECKH